MTRTPGRVTRPTPAAPPVGDEHAVELVVCPQCGQTATVQWRDTLDSTDGPIEPARIDSPAGHWFVLPAARLGGFPGAPLPGHRVVATG